MRRRRKLIRRRSGKYKKLRRGVVRAGTAAAISLGTGITLHKALAAFPPDVHQLPVPNDADADLLADKEEAAIGYRPFNPDQNCNEIPDGIELAKRCADAVEQLPLYGQAEPNEIYKLESPAVDGMEYCHVCGELVYMGGWYIINPRLHLQYPEPNDSYNWEFLPELALHYMQHGSFDYLGDVHRGRADIARLLWVLQLRYPNDPNAHQLPLDYVVEPGKQLASDANDYDGDLLADSEELAAGLNLYDPDQDANLVPDGIDLAMQLADGIDALPVWNPREPVPEPDVPYKINNFLRGLEDCMICGASVNMGWWTVVNPRLEVSIDVYDIVCHYMHHGSFSYSGGLHGGRINVSLLARILEMPLRCGHLGTVYLPGDFNKDCAENFKDFADFADKWLQSTEPTQDRDGSSMITYNIVACDPSGKTVPLSPPAPPFSVRVEGPYILFEDMMHANCCPGELELNMSREGNIIRLDEAEHVGAPCPCECDFPTDATLGPFEEGSYLVEVYKQLWDTSGELLSEQFKGFAEVTVGPG